MGVRPDQGDIVVGEIYPNEGFAILTCGNTQVRIGYSALHAICSNYCVDGRSLNLKTLADFDHALKAITAEAALGRNANESETGKLP